MQEITLKGTTYQLPTAWNEVNVRQLIEIEQIKNNDLQSLGQIAAVLLGCDVDEVLRAELSEFSELISKVGDVMTAPLNAKFQSNINLNGVSYTARNIEDFSTREFTDFDTLSADGKKNLPLLLALIYHAENEEGDYVEQAKKKAEIFENLPADIAVAAVSFFSVGLLNFVKNTLLSSESASRMMKKNPETMKMMEQLEDLINGAGN